LFGVIAQLLIQVMVESRSRQLSGNEPSKELKQFLAWLVAG